MYNISRRYIYIHTKNIIIHADDGRKRERERGGGVYMIDTLTHILFQHAHTHTHGQNQNGGGEEEEEEEEGEKGEEEEEGE
jgi:hypothetical protein